MHACFTLLLTYSHTIFNLISFPISIFRKRNEFPTDAEPFIPRRTDLRRTTTNFDSTPNQLFAGLFVKERQENDQESSGLREHSLRIFCFQIISRKPEYWGDCCYSEDSVYIEADSACDLTWHPVAVFM